MALQLLVALVVLVGGVVSNPCTFSYGNFHVTYGVRDASVHFRLSLTGVAQGHSGWTAIGFGQSMGSGLDVIVVRLLNGRVIVTDEFVQGFTSPYPDRVNNVIMRETSWNNGVVVASFSRALNTGEYPYDMPLQGCTTWQFAAGLHRMSPQGHMYHHTQTPIAQTVCLHQCRV